MLIFFGTRVSLLKQRKIENNTTCPNCKAENSFIANTFARYFHIFWIPFFPLMKSNQIVCTNCEQTYKKREFAESVRAKLDRADSLDPPKRPIWHGCGCLIIVALAVVLLILTLISPVIVAEDEASDIRKKYLNQDLKKTTSSITFESDSISYRLKTCVSLTIEGINTERVGYYSKIDGNKLLVLMKVKDFKKVEPSSRKQLVFAVEECLDAIMSDDTYQYYIGINGFWNMVMVKTPYDSNLGGKYAYSDLLLPFYGDALPEVETDTLNIE